MVGGSLFGMCQTERWPARASSRKGAGAMWARATSAAPMAITIHMFTSHLFARSRAASLGQSLSAICHSAMRLSTTWQPPDPFPSHAKTHLRHGSLHGPGSLNASELGGTERAARLCAGCSRGNQRLASDGEQERPFTVRRVVGLWREFVNHHHRPTQ